MIFFQLFVFIISLNILNAQIDVSHFLLSISELLVMHFLSKFISHNFNKFFVFKFYLYKKTQ